MRRLLVLLCCSCSTLCAQKMEWKHDLGEARDSAYAQPAFLLVYVEQRYQSESEKMDLRTWSDASVIARAARFVCVRIDVADPIRGTLLGFADFANAFMTRHKVTDLPTTLVLDPAEGEVARSAGYTTAEEMRTLLDSLPSGLAPLYGILKEVAANDDAVRPRIAAAEAYTALRLPAASAAYLERVRDSDSLKADAGLRERVDYLTAMNEAELHETAKAAELFERMLDAWPSSERRPACLYMLVRLSLTMLDDVKAHDYARILTAEFPNSEYARNVGRLFAR